MRQIQKMKKIIIGIFLSIFALPAMAITVSGAVVDSESSEPLAGATILETGTNNYTIADANGAFTLDKVNDNSTLTIQYVTYKDKTIKAESTVGTIKLESDTILDEVVVTTSNIGQPCGQSVLPANATAGTWQKDSYDKTICVVSECATGYKVNKKTNTCFKSEPCSKIQLLPIYAASGHTDIDASGRVICIPDECDPGYEKIKDNKCESISGKPCKKLPAHAKKGIRGLNVANKEVCFVTECAGKYLPSDNGTECVLSEGECSTAELQQIANATKGEKLKGVCKATECKEDYKVKNGKCVSKNGDECTASDTNATKAKYKNINNKLQCVITQCKNGYMPNNDGTACEVSEGSCNKNQVNAIEHATKGELKQGVCHATECDGGYEVSGGKCVEISGDCKPMPANAKIAHRVWNAETNSEQCIIDECAADYNVSDDELSCIEKPQPTLTAEQSAAKVQELRENYNTQKAKEQSTANKLIGAAGIGATGIGAQMAASALAEQRADDAAEADMTAYLATFKCDYGMGRNINGGDKEVELPGGNDLLSLYNEYKTLADDLKTRKEALGLSAGIESQVILDKASTGLYDDESTGITNGTYASLARALANPTGTDAEKWNAQKSETSQKLKAGAITAGVGAAASLVADVAVNSGAAKQNRSDEIVAKYAPLYKLQNDVAKYAPLYKLQNDVAKLPNSEASITCPSDTTGTYPNCECENKDKRVFNTNSNMCEACQSDRIVQDGKCVVDAPNAKCDTSDPNIVVAADGACSCQNGFHPSADGQTCECPTTGFTLVDGQCVPNNTTLTALPQITQQSTGLMAQVATDIIPAQHVVLPAKNLFELGQSTLTQAAKNTITSFASQVKTSVAKGNSSDYCITIVGHTDKTGNAQLNNNLSVNRANAIKEALISAGLSVQNIQASGRGQTECTMNGAQESCRKVDITYRDSKC